MNRTLFAVAIAAVGASAATAAPVMHVHDSNAALGTVDVASGQVSVIGSMGVLMTDIAFNPNGALFGLSFNSLYSIDPMTAAVSFIGNHRIPAGNALVFGTTGTLYAAGNLTTSLFTINPATGIATNLGDMGFASGGDLAFHSGALYLASAMSQLVRVDLTNIGNSAAVGPFGVAGVFGLATGDNGVLYGVAGTQIFSVDTRTGAATNPVNYAGQGLGIAFGQSFATEAGPPPPPPPPPDGVIPEPSTYATIAGALVLLLGVRWQRSRKAAGDARREIEVDQDRMMVR